METSKEPKGAEVTVVVVTYQSAETVGAALAPLREGHEAGLLRCIVVDNRSSDGTADRVERDHPWAEVVRSQANLGYGRGCNLGFDKADTPYVLFMNPDAVIEPASIVTLRDFLERHPKAGMAAPATRTSDGGYQHAGGIPTPWKIIRHAAGFPSEKNRWTILPEAEASRTDWLCGAILLVRASAFRDLGGFDPRFFLYFEETDLCRRFSRAGWEIWGVGSALAAHDAGSSARTVDPAIRGGDWLPRHFYPSRYHYLVKHHGWTAAALAEGFELVLKAFRDLARLVLFRPRRREFARRLQGPVFTRPPRTT